MLACKVLGREERSPHAPSPSSQSAQQGAAGLQGGGTRFSFQVLLLFLFRAEPQVLAGGKNAVLLLAAEARSSEPKWRYAMPHGDYQKLALGRKYGINKSHSVNSESLTY